VKLSCQPDSLKIALKTAGPAVAKRATLPILEHVMLSANGDGSLAVSATDLAVGIRTRILAKIDEPGMITVPARTLIDLVNVLPDERIDLEMNAETATLALACGRTKAHVKGMPGQEFPVISDYSQEDGLPTLTIQPADLAKALSRTVFSAAGDDARPSLNCVYMHIADGKLAFASADGFRMSVQHTGIVADFPDLLIPKAALTEVQKLVANESEPVRIVANKVQDASQVAFIFSDTHLVAQLVPGRFPDYGQIIPEKHSVQITVSPSALHRAIKTALVFGKLSAGIVRWTLGDDQIVISGTNAETGDQTSTVPAEIEGALDVPAGDESRFALNGHYVLGMLAAMGSVSQVQITGTTPSCPFVVTTPEDENYIHVMMPMHLGG